jgi:ATP-dependent exoDNAse (exonuclease V) beta subunit
LENNLPSQVINLLIQLGPIARGELENISIAAKLREITQNSDTIFLQELGAEADYDINSLLNNYQLHYQDLEFYPRNYFYIPAFDQAKGKKYSASKLQTYIDCPYKYYLTYELKANDDLDLRKYVTPSELGNLMHSLIAQGMRISGENLDYFITSHFDTFLQEHKKVLSTIEYLKNLTKLREQVFNAIEFLSLFTGAKYSFEKKIENGRIDCVIEWQGRTGIFDFKSSLYNTTISSIINFDRVQLWYYAVRLNERPSWIGFINCKDIRSSKIFSKIEFPHVKVSLIENLDDYLKDYTLWEERLEERMSSGDFYPNPINNGCNYCLIRNICERSLCR